MPKYKIQFQVESNDFCGIVEYGQLIDERIDAIVDNPELSAFEKDRLLDDILIYSEEFTTAEEDVLESAIHSFNIGYEGDTDSDEYSDEVSDLNSTSRFKVVTNDEEEREIKL